MLGSGWLLGVTGSLIKRCERKAGYEGKVEKATRTTRFDRCDQGQAIRIFIQVYARYVPPASIFQAALCTVRCGLSPNIYVLADLP